MSDVIVTVEHLRIARERHGGYCLRGVDAWLKRYGMTSREFLRRGYPASRLEATGDDLGVKIARIARDLSGAA